MSRRSKKSPVLISVVIALIVAGIAGAFAFRVFTKPYRTVQALPMADYTSNALGLVGNRYKIKGNVENLLQSDAAAGRLVVIKTRQGPLAVIFPASFSTINVEKGQKLVMVGEVLSNGLVKVSEFQKQ